MMTAAFMLLAFAVGFCAATKLWEAVLGRAFELVDTAHARERDAAQNVDQS